MEQVGISAIALYVLISAVGSLLVGMIGTGSSLVLLPSLVFAFTTLLDGYDSLRIAAGTTMATIAVGASAGAIAQYAKGNVDLRLVRLLAIPYSAGALLGPWLSGIIRSESLQLYIAALLTMIAFVMLGRKPQQTSISRNYTLHRLELCIFSAGIAVACSLGGVASGVLAMPYLMRFSLPTRTIIGSSTAAAAIYASFAAIGYIIAVPEATALPPGAIGYVYMPAFVIMASISILATPVGVQLGQRINEAVFRLIFAGFLFLAAVGIFMR